MKPKSKSNQIQKAYFVKVMRFITNSNTLLVLVTLFASVLIFLHLGRGDVAGFDEKIYSSVSQSIVQSNDWITLHWMGAEFFHKPPLEIWMTALSFKVLGVSTLSARIVSALFGVGIVALVFLFGKRHYDLGTAVVASIVTVASPLFLLFARQGMMDTTLTFFGLLAVYAFARKKDHIGWWYLSWMSLGLAVMTKGAAAVPIFAAVIITMIIIDGWRLLREKIFWRGLGVFLIIALPWHVAMILMHDQFLSQYIGYHVIERSTMAIEGHLGGPYFYIDSIQQHMAPWASLIFLGFISLAANFKKDVRFVVPLVYILVILGFYTIVQTKIDWYIYPLIPFAALCVGWIFSAAAKSARSYEYYFIWAAALLTAFLSRPKPIMLLILILVCSILFKRYKGMSMYSAYAVFMFFMMNALTIIRSVSSIL